MSRVPGGDGWCWVERGGGVLCHEYWVVLGGVGCFGLWYR